MGRPRRQAEAQLFYRAGRIITTIAYRDGVIAGDSQINNGDHRVGTMAKVFRREDGALCGCCGSMSVMRSFGAWFMRNDQSDPPKFAEKDLCAMIIRLDGTIESHDDLGWHVVEAPYYATGSGQQFALAAMYCGMDPPNAVKVAAHFDNFTGGKIVTLCRTPDNTGDEK